MDKEFVNGLIETNEELQIYEDYSGRGMFGATTTGIVGTFDGFFSAVGEYAHELVHNALDAKGTGDRVECLSKSEAFSESMRSLRWDNLGRQFIFY